MNSSEVLANIRDLIVHLHRGNASRAEVILGEVAAHIKQVLLSGADPNNSEMQKAQQTMFAIDEVRTLMAQHDLEGAGAAARDAAKEWKHKPAPAATVE